jgi:putative sterol carrier protein
MMLQGLLVANYVAIRRSLVAREETAVASIVQLDGRPKTAVRNVIRAMLADLAKPKVFVQHARMVLIKENMISQFEKRAATAAPIGGTLKFEVDGVGILIDGSGDTNTVKASDDATDCTISLTAEVLQKLRDGDINPMMAVMGGQIKISGDMGLAMKVQSLMG